MTRHGFVALGTRCLLEIHGASEVAGATAIAIVLAEVERIERKYSRYDARSFVSEISRVAQLGGPIDVDEKTISGGNALDSLPIVCPGAWPCTP